MWVVENGRAREGEEVGRGEKEKRQQALGEKFKWDSLETPNYCLKN